MKAVKRPHLGDDVKQGSVKRDSTETPRGFILNLTPMKVSQRTSKEFFNFVLQTEERKVDGVGFSDRQRMRLKDLAVGDNGVELKGAYLDRDKKVVVPDTCKINSVNLRYRKETVEASVMDLDKDDWKDMAEHFCVHAKVTGMLAVAECDGSLRKQQLYVAKGSTEVLLVLFAKHVDKLSIGNSYEFDGVKARCIDNKFYLIGTPNLDISEAQEIEVNDSKFHMKDRVTLDGFARIEIIAVKRVETYMVCVVCKRDVDLEEQVAKFIKCDCGAVMRRGTVDGKIEFCAVDAQREILHFFSEKRFFKCVDDKVFSDVMVAAEMLMDLQFEVWFDKKPKINVINRDVNLVEVSESE